MEVKPLYGKARLAFHLSDRRVNIWEGSVSSGKTVSSLLRWIDFVTNSEPGPLLMAGKTERTLKRNVIDPIMELLGSDRVKLKVGAGEVHIMGRKIYICGANDELAQEKIRGLSLRGAYCDELSTFPQSFATMLLSRLRLENAKMFATTNPDSMMHWLYTEFLENASLHVQGDGRIKRIAGQLDLARFSFRLEDNRYLPVDYIDSIKREYTGLWYKRFIEGLWVLAEGAIYDMFDPDIHVVNEMPVDMEFLSVGVDYGTVNPFAGVALGLSDGKMYVTSEMYYDSRKEKRQKTDSEYLRDLVDWLGNAKNLRDYGQFANPRFVCIDPSARSFIVESLMGGVFTPTKANNSVIDGIRCVSSLLANKQLFIHKSCEHLIKELSTYSWDNNAALKGLDVPLKVHDHASDALRYAVYTTRSLWKSQVVDYSYYQTAAA